MNSGPIRIFLAASVLLSVSNLGLGQEPLCDKAKPAACRDLGVKYEDGKGVKKDEARAAALYQLACDGADGTVRLWEVSTAKEGLSLTAHEGAAYARGIAGLNDWRKQEHPR